MIVMTTVLLLANSIKINSYRVGALSHIGIMCANPSGSKFCF